MKIDRYKDGKFVGGSWRWPTPAEIRWQVWTSIQEGAKGFFFFLYRYKAGPPKRGDDIEGLRDRTGSETPQFRMASQIGRRLKRLAPILLEIGPSREKQETVYWENTPVSGRTFVQRKTGRRFLIVVNHDCSHSHPIGIELGYYPGLLDKNEKLYNLETQNEFDYQSIKTATLPPGDGIIYFVGTPKEWKHFQNSFEPSQNHG